MSNYLPRADVAKILMTDIDDSLVVCGIGTPVSDVANTGDRDLNFYMLGAMGCAAGVGLGLALAQPDRTVVVVTGDSELMMNVGLLATIGVMRPANLSIVVFDNEQYGETGQQTSHTAHGVDIAAIALASGFSSAETVHALPQVAEVAASLRKRNGPYLAVIKVAAGRVPPAIPVKDGVVIKTRFRNALLNARQLSAR